MSCRERTAGARGMPYVSLYQIRCPIKSTYTIIPANITLAIIPATVDKRAPFSVYLVFVTLAAMKYTLMV